MVNPIIGRDAQRIWNLFVSVSQCIPTVSQRLQSEIIGFLHVSFILSYGYSFYQDNSCFTYLAYFTHISGYCSSLFKFWVANLSVHVHVESCFSG